MSAAPVSELSRPDNKPKRVLEPVERRLSVADRVMQREAGASLLVRSWLVPCGGLLALFALDVLLHLAVGPRLALLGTWVLVSAGLVLTCAWIAWIRRNPVEHTARALESRDQHLGSKLINILQLDQQTRGEQISPLTRDLAAQAIEGYAKELDRFDLPKIAHTGRVRQDLRRTAWGVGAFAVLQIGFFDITKTELLRYFDPFGDHPPYSFTRLEITEPGEDTAQVIYGQPILVGVQSSGHRPGELFLSYWPVNRPDAVTTLPMFDKGDRGFSQQIEDVQDELVVIAHTKNRHSMSKQRRIGVVLTPKLDRAHVKMSPPEYTRIAPAERLLQFKALKALSGTRLDFRLSSNRPLSEGVIEVIKSADEIERVPMSPIGEQEVAGGFVAAATARLRFALVDRDGHASHDPWEVALQVTHDLAPDVTINNPSADCFAAMDFKMEPVIEANDDYGLKTLRIHQARNGKYADPQVIHFDELTKNTRQAVMLDFASMGLESGDTVSIFAEAIDTAPEPHISRSQVVTITVISVEDYNEYLRERTDMADLTAKYSELVNKLHDLLEEQRELGKEAEALQAQIEKAPEAEKAALEEKMNEMLAKQNELNAKLNKLANHMDEFVRDQPLFDIENELKEILEEKAEQIRESTKQNDAANQQIAQQQSGGQQSGADAMRDFKAASDQQLQRLGAAEQQLAQEAVQPLEDLSLLHELMKDLNRFKELYEAQQQLAEQTKAYDRPGPLTREDQLALKDLAAQEKRIGEELDAVEQKLWEDAKAAEEKFPKAAESGKQLAQAMGDQRLQMHANNATKAMVQGQGDQSSQLAQKLLAEMEKLFSEECNNAGQEAGGELDSYLSLTRGMQPGNNFKQMMQTRKFGKGGKAGFSGQSGESGESGYAVQTGPNSQVFGNETRASEQARRSGRQGLNKTAPLPDEPRVAVENQDTLEGMDAQNRESSAVQGETTVEQYRTLVEKYFEALTREKKP